MRRVIVVLAAMLGMAGNFSGSAIAADMVLKAPPTPVFTWTGFYVGAHVGGGWARTEWTDPAGPPFDLGSHTATGWLGGFQVGGNYQIGQWVFGVEGQFSWARLDGNHVSIPDPADVLSTRADWIS